MSRRRLLATGLVLLWVTAGFVLDTQARFGEGVQPTTIPGLSYLGNASCAASGCHAEAEATIQSGQKIGDESNIWSAHDPHAGAFRTLKNDESVAMAAKLSIDDAATSSKCLTCHAMDVPDKRRGELFAITDSVGCESCHGPAEKWLNPHAEKGWTIGQRASIGSKGMFDTLGLVDTSSIEARANTCVACHLQIDKAMVDAGHPALTFELYAYNYYTSYHGGEYAIHWDEPTDRMIDVRLWAAGQAAGRHAAIAQAQQWKDPAADALLAVYEAGFAVAKKHFGADTVAGLAAAEYTAANTAAAAKELASKADDATTVATRRIIGSGVAAIASSSFEASGKEIPEAFWDAYDRATSGEGGEDYAKALNAMADLAGK